MKFLIIGNIGAGKTTIGEMVSELSGFTFVQIDGLREEYMKEGKVSENYLSMYHFIRCAELQKDVILEFSGVGCHKYSVKRALELSGDQVVVVVCQTRDFETVVERTRSKVYTYTFPFEIDLNKHIFYVRDELAKDMECGFWEWERSRVVSVWMDREEDVKENMRVIRGMFGEGI